MKKSQMIALIGGLIVIIGTFLPYVSVGGKSLNMFSMGGPAKTVATVFIVFAVLSSILGFLGKEKLWWLSVINLIFSGIGALLIFMHIGKLNKETGLDIGIAVYAIALGFTAGLVSSVLGIMRK